MKNVLILGANSAMARAMAREIAGPEVQLILASRNVQELEKTAQDLTLRKKSPRPIVLAFDACKLEQHERFVAQVLAKVKTLDEVYLFFGQLHPQEQAQKDFQLAQEMLVANYVGAASILERVALHMEEKGRGLIVGVSSVAGDRGRQSNYLYGSSKAGLTTYLQGLRNRLAHKGVHVLTVKPGFVDTPMTHHMKKGLLFARPETIAAGIVKAKRRKKDTVYLPGFWKWIMLVVTSIPEWIFKKMRM
ncbi:SDR family oxidoreductase [candidate division FCPU426 bacterium]|nr:SDR family oxidoreductase [candidate division FCPU426 bacterium]